MVWGTNIYAENFGPTDRNFQDQNFHDIIVEKYGIGRSIKKKLNYIV